jgi:DNA polymerase-3 subunit gamma/tau
MGVEMTLLRALAFHPRMPLPEPEVPRQSFAPAPRGGDVAAAGAAAADAAAAAERAAVGCHQFGAAARSQLQRAQGATKPKRVNRQRHRARPVNNAALERLVR